MPPTIAQRFWQQVSENPSKPAFFNVEQERVQSLTWSELGAAVAGVVEDLLQLQLPAGSHVASCARNSLSWILWDLSAHTLGLVHVSIDPREPLKRRRELLNYAEALWCLEEPESESKDCNRVCSAIEVATGRRITFGTLVRPFEVGHASQRGESKLQTLTSVQCFDLSEAVAANAPASMLFTSGSVGKPKGVLLSHRNLLSNAIAKLDAAPQTPDDRRLNILPFAHAYARSCELSTWILSGGELAVAANWTEWMRQAPVLQPTLVNLVPFLAEKLCDSLEREGQSAGGRLRLIQVGGAALPSELWNRLARHGLPAIQGYGLTEAGPVVCSNRSGDQKPGTVGPPVAGVEIRIEADQTLSCRGPGVMIGYWKDANATQNILRDGWLQTGDLAEVDASGHVRILGRRCQEIRLSTGYKISPEQLEDCLRTEVWIEHAIIVGEGQPYVVALIWPAITELRKLLPPPAQPDAALLSEALPAAAQVSAASELLRGRIELCLQAYPEHAVPKKFLLVDEPLSVESGTLTFKGVPFRSEIHKRYQTLVDSLYPT